MEINRVNSPSFGVLLVAKSNGTQKFIEDLPKERQIQLEIAKFSLKDCKNYDLYVYKPQLSDDLEWVIRGKKGSYFGPFVNEEYCATYVQRYPDKVNKNGLRLHKADSSQSFVKVNRRRDYFEVKPLEHELIENYQKPISIPEAAQLTKLFDDVAAKKYRQLPNVVNDTDMAGFLLDTYGVPAK